VFGGRRPARRRPLPARKEEGGRITELFRSFNTCTQTGAKISVEVVPAVWCKRGHTHQRGGKLITSQFDILQFCGSLRFFFFVRYETARRAGYARRRGLSANALNRIDRVPKCSYSPMLRVGRMPDRPADRYTSTLRRALRVFFRARRFQLCVYRRGPRHKPLSNFSLSVYGGLLV